MNPGLPAVLACGAWLKNAACLLEDGQPQWSPLHGDLGDPAACVALERSLDTLLAQSGVPLQAVAHDLHPDFHSSRLAVALAERLDVPAVGVQHHHAHIAAVMAEHGLTEPVVGLALDGVGLGTDGLAWGGELLWVAPGDWRRLGHLWPLRLAGGDTAARTVARMLDTGLNSPPTTSTGRWFDAAAGALGLSVRQSHEAEAAIALETAAKRWCAQHGEPSLDVDAPAACSEQLDLRPLVATLFDTPADAVDAAAARFHFELADALARWALEAARATGVDTVCLGGGCFMNALLTRRVTLRLQRRGLRVLRPQSTSCGDAGLAWGQAWAVAQQILIAPHTHSEMLSCV